MGISPQHLAIAAEALNRHPQLSPSARRVGLELLNHMDRATGLAWPSEARLAEALAMTARTVRRAKSELAGLGLLTWTRRGTSRKGRTPLYRLAIDRLLSLAGAIKGRLRAATEAARSRLRPPAPPTPKPSNDGPRPAVGRTFSPAYLTQCFKVSTGGGFWKAPGTPQGQTLTDQQLRTKAQARLYDALTRLGATALAEFLARPDAAQLEAMAIDAERYRPGAGLALMADRLRLV